MIFSLAFFSLTYGQVDTVEYRPHDTQKNEITLQKTVSRDGVVVKSKSKNQKTKYTVDNSNTNKKNMIKPIYNRIQ